MNILAIESSCDETSAAIVEDGRDVLSVVIASSKTQFADAGGVIPEEAARKQIACMIPVMQKTCGDAGISFHDVDLIAVTRGPGLLGSLLVGTMTARVLATIARKPLLGVHHTLGHLDSVWLRRKEAKETKESKESEAPAFPCVTLSVSGGHTELWLRRSHTNGKLIGDTRDDAAGEAFDKGALLLGLPYPGGPALAKLAEGGNELAYDFPLPLHDEQRDFSFSGLKTALKYTLRDIASNDQSTRINLAASYQYAICRHLTGRIAHACAMHAEVKEVHIVGGVSANTRLRMMVREHIPASVTVRWPAELVYCTDNAAMIGAAAYFVAQEKLEWIDAPFATEATCFLQ